MSLVLNGTDGLSDVDGSAATPAIRGTDANTGIFFPAADTIAFAEGGTEVMRIDSSGNVGIGTSSPTTRLEVSGAFGTSTTGITLSNSTSFNASNIARFDFRVNNSFGGLERIADIWALNPNASANNGGALVFGTSANGTATTPTERMRLDSSGNLLVGKTTTAATTAGSVFSASDFFALSIAQATGNRAVIFSNTSGTGTGNITINASTTSFNTSSDYRLKNTIAPMTGALAKVALLKPCTYKWKVDGSDGQGFIAHELAEVEPGCVTGEKDAVDAEGNPQYQGIDTSFLVATLTAAIQEQQAIIIALTARVAALEGTQP